MFILIFVICFFRFCELFTSDLEMRGGRGRGKRVRFVVVVSGSEVSFIEFRGL